MVTRPGENVTAKNRTQANADEISVFSGAVDSVSQFGQAAGSQTAEIGRNLGGALADEITGGSSGLASRIRGRRLPQPGTQQLQSKVQAQWKADDVDWRVKLSVPPAMLQHNSSGNSLLAPLAESGNKMIFPYTPTIILSHSANYNSLSPVHTNYPYQIYENSSVGEIVITGDFTVENSKEGQYWVAVMHYLRSVTKMFYGEGEYSGAPPSIVYLNGYGDYVFNNVPCVVTNFTVDMPADVDYITVPVSSPVDREQSETGPESKQGFAWAPTQSLVTVTLQPTYSRKDISQFNLNDFVNGNYITNGKGFI